MQRLCKFCNLIIEGRSKQSFAGHVRNCKQNPRQAETAAKIKATKDSRRVLRTKTIKCQKCSKLFQVLKSAYLRKYCSRRCANGHIITAEHRAKVSITIRSQVWRRKTAQGVCKICAVPLFYTKQCCSRACYKQYVNSPESKQKFREIAQKRFQQNPELHPNRRCAKIKESYPERMLREFLEQQGLRKDRDYYTQHRVERYYTDFYFPSINVGVEVDGERWHRDRAREEKRELVIKKYMQLRRFKVSLLIQKAYEQEILDLVQAVKNAGVT